WDIDKTGKGFFNPAKLTENLRAAKLPTAVDDILIENKRLAFILLDESHPLSAMVRASGVEKMTDVIKFLSGDEDLLKQFLRYPQMANDHRIQAAFAGKKFNAARFKAVFEERLVVWQKFTRGELAALSNEPRLTTRFSQLKDAVASQEKALEQAKRTGQGVEEATSRLKASQDLRRLLVTPDSGHARFLAAHADELAFLFQDTKKAQEALARFSKIDSRILRLMQNVEDTKNWDDAARLIGHLNKADDAGIAVLVAKYEKKAGSLGRTAMRLDRLKHGVGERVKGAPGRLAARAQARLEATKWYEGFEKWRGVKFRVDDLTELSQLKNVKKIIAALEVKNIPSAAAQEMAREIAKTDKLDEIEAVIKRVSEGNGIKVKFSPKIAKLMKLARLGGAALSVTGTVMSGWEAYSAFAEAAETSDSERRNVLLQKGGLWTANLIADGAGTYALVAGLGGGAAAGSAVATVGAAAMPLIPLTYMGTAALESKYETTKTVDEWRAVDHKQLIHEWVSTHGVGAGDAYRLFTGQKEIEVEKQATRQKIAEAIINAEENRRPGAPADPDRMHYLQVMCDFYPPAHYQAALDLLRESKLYADIMLTRRSALAEREKNPQSQARVAGLDLLDPRFEAPDKKGILSLLTAFRRHALEQIPEDLQYNFSQFSDRYLIDLYCESLAYLQSGIADSAEEEKTFTYRLRNFLIHRRRINVEKEYLQWMAEHKELDAEAARDKIAGFQDHPTQALEEDLKNHTRSKPVYALYELAKFFGYTGYPNEDALKAFFDEGHGGALGIYWDGENWYVNEAGMERDENLGPHLTRPVIQKMIAELRENSADVIETRQDAMVDIVEDDQFKSQVNQMAVILEKGLEKEPPKKQELKPTSSLPDEERETEMEEDLAAPESPETSGILRT
ncbi:MAG: hypothetical protein V1760_02300, partial [Candidatus Peregrinibacteria bacterium]